MNNFLQKIKFEKFSVVLIIITIFIVMIILFYLSFTQEKREIKLLSFNEGEEVKIEEIYSITWSSKDINRVGIVLFKGDNPQWIAKNIDANLGKYEWTVEFGQEYGGNYWIAVFEYPWYPGAVIDYSTRSFNIIPGAFYTCEQGAVNKEWLYISSSFPGARRIFVTPTTYGGDLGGLEGADKICQESAEKLNLEGRWMAFIGGEREGETLIERLNNTTLKTEGIFVEAGPDFELKTEEGCHRFVAKNFSELVKIFSGTRDIYSHKLSSKIFPYVDKIWLGRVDSRSEESCISLPDISGRAVSTSERYSFTSTCQNWTRSESYVTGHTEEDRDFAQCFTPEGDRINALRLGGLSSSLVEGNFVLNWGKTCDRKQYLLCVEY